MSAPNPTRAALALQAVTDALHAALLEEDGEAVSRALIERDQRLAELAEGLAAADPPDARLAALIRRVQGSDAEARALAEQRLGAVRAELDQLRQARAVARSLAVATAPARFVDKRV